MHVIFSLAAFSLASGLTTPQSRACTSTHLSQSPRKSPWNKCQFTLFSTADNSGDEDDVENDILITKEMFMRDMLADPQVKRKKKNGRYRTMDNRDSLPFVVQVSTPDPYTSSDEMKKEARKNTKKAARKKGSGNGKTRKNLLGMSAPGTKDGIASSIYSRKTDGSLHRVLGEFKLDKNTNCGDLIEVEDREFEVQKARCQYKYAGGQRFIMVRKILEVKEVTRIAEENFLQRQIQNSKSDDDSVPALE